MATARELYEERLNRIKTAVALGKPDRVPVVPLGNAVFAKYMNVKLSRFCTEPMLANETILRAVAQLGDVDGIQQTTYNVYSLCLLWLSDVKIPGRDLPDDDLWQVNEQELMKEEDYDVIINKGYGYFLNDYFTNRLGNVQEKVRPFLESIPQTIRATEEQGLVPLSPGVLTIPYENFCGGRSLSVFLRDLYRLPDKVRAAMDVAMAEIINDAKALCQNLKPIAVWVGGWRSASEFLSPRLWQKFVFPYYKQLVEAVTDEGVIAILHFDSNWTRDLEYLRAFPKGKCVLALDGATDIFKAKEILGDHMCIMGDVPASMFALGTPDDVYSYCRKLIDNIGPAGFILSSGCDIPTTAKLENVKAMIESAKG
ncbi:MAG: uroporphyrinogen-III decarboxylase [Firmicutes bacterium]|nr:uroporphyrinogen-III decarboxylase [Bacillota bacterium]